MERSSVFRRSPVPVNKVKRIKSVLGGAANVAANLAHLECRVFMGGVTGADNNREVLEAMMAEKGIDYSGLIKSQQRETITKMRILGAQQQMLRLDFEETGDLFPEETEALSLWLQNLLEAGLDGVIVSDYAKGVCSDNFVQWGDRGLRISIMCRCLLTRRGLTGINIGAVISLLQI